MTDIRAALEQAAHELEIAENALLCSSFHNAAQRAKQAARATRAALAQPTPQSATEDPSVVHPADGEVAELVALIRQIALAWEPDACLLGNMTAGQLARAADLLERLAPQPVPVGERLPGPEDCALWPGEPEAIPWCWAGKDIDGGWEWAQISMFGLGADTLSRIIAGGGWTHWLPAHSLPLP
jgi:hypothetical protein